MNINKAVKEQIKFEKSQGEKYVNAVYLSDILAINYGIFGKTHAICFVLKKLAQNGTIHMTSASR